MASYKDFNREIKGYVEANYGTILQDNLTCNLYASASDDITTQINNMQYSQTIADTLSTPRILKDYALLYENYTSLDGSYYVFNQVNNESGFYSENKLQYYIDNFTARSKTYLGLALQLGTTSSLISDDIYGISIYTQGNKFKVAEEFDNITAYSMDSSGTLIETSTNVHLYDNQMFIIFENSLKDKYVSITGFDYSDYSIPIRITHIDLGITHIYKDNELISFNIIEQVDKLVEEVPQNELSVHIGDYEDNFNILNPKGITNYLNNNCTLIPYIGIKGTSGIDYTKMGVFYFDNWDSQNKEVSITAYNLIGKFVNSEYDDKFTTEHPSYSPHGTWDYGFGGYDTLKNIFEKNSDYTLTDTTKCASYSDMTTYIYPPLTYNLDSAKILKLLNDYTIIANGIIYADRDNNTIIRPIDTTIKNSITKSELISNVKYNKLTSLKSIKTESPFANYTISSLTETQLKSGNILFQETYKLKKSREMHFVTLDTQTNATITSSNANVTAILATTSNTRYMGEIVLIGNVGDETTVTITLSANTTKYDFSTKENHSRQLTGEGELDISLDIAFQLNSTTGEDILNHYSSKYPTYEASFSYNGDATIKAGDYINVETDYGTIPLFINRHELTYDGGLSGYIEGVE